MTLCEVEVYACETCDVELPDGYVAPAEVAQGQPATQSSEGWGGAPGRAVDGNVNGAYGGNSCTHTNGANSWWQVDLGATQTIYAVDVFHRTDCCQDRLVSANIIVSEAAEYSEADSGATTCGPLSDPFSNPERSVCPNVAGQFVTVSMTGNHMTLCEVMVYACGGDGQLDCDAVPPPPPTNYARSQPTTQSSEGWGGRPSRAVDGNKNGQYGGNSCTHTNGSPSWWQVDLGDAIAIDTVAITHRTDCCQDRLAGAQVWVSGTDEYSSGSLCGALSNPSNNPEESDCANAVGQYVTVFMDGGSSGGRHMTLCEVEVYAGEEVLAPVNVAQGQPATQSSEGWGGAPGRAVDGNINGQYGAGSCTHTNGSPSWWQVDLGATQTIYSVQVTHRTDCCQDRLVSADIYVSDTGNYTAGTTCGPLSDP